VTDVEITVHRRSAATEPEQLARYRVAVEPGQSLWDWLAVVARDVDPTVAFRQNCFAGSCGECGVVVNGAEVLGCEAVIADLGAAIDVRPLRHHTVLRDLVVDREDHFARLDAAHAYFVGEEFHETVPDTELDVARRVTSCLHCGLCLSACQSLDLEEHRDFIGPAALAWVARFATDPRDAAPGDRQEVADSRTGVAGCISCGACNDVCPAGVAPLAMIELLR
jgi:succinate dehydrogenase/fumarate reductase iron-sulfur protein